MNAHDLKGLQVRLAKANSEMGLLRGEQGDISRRITAKSSLIKKLSQEIEDATPKEIHVTEHALLRYIERFSGLDLDEVEKLILEPLNGMGTFAKSGKFPIGDGLRAVVKNYAVVTVEPSK